MLSTSYSIVEFMKKAEGHSYEEIIWMADQEATEAERRFYRLGRSGDSDKILSYTRYLKDFILYMRHGVRTLKTRDLKLDPFRKIRLEH